MICEISEEDESYVHFEDRGSRIYRMF